MAEHIECTETYRGWALKITNSGTERSLFANYAFCLGGGGIPEPKEVGVMGRVDIDVRLYGKRMMASQPCPLNFNDSQEQALALLRRTVDEIIATLQAQWKEADDG